MSNVPPTGFVTIGAPGEVSVAGYAVPDSVGAEASGEETASLR